MSGEPDLVPVGDLVPAVGNPRKGDVAAIAKSLAALGQYRPIVANRGTETGRPGEILAGNHTYLAACRLGWEEIRVSWVDVDDEKARQIMLADNRLGEMGTYDWQNLADAMDGLDLTPTGWTFEDMEKVEAKAGGTPYDSGESETFVPRFLVVVECANEEEQAEVYQHIKERGHECHPLKS